MWEILGIKPTTDIKTIKSAYARLAKQYNPEEHPEEFRRIHEAYRQASAFAKRMGKRENDQIFGDGVDLSALSRSAEKPEFDFSDVDENKRTYEENASVRDFDFSAVNTDNMEMSDEERQEMLRMTLLSQISELLSDKKRIKNYDEWSALFSAPEFTQIVNDSEFRVGAARLFAFKILTKEAAELAASSFGDGSEIVRINSLANEWAVNVGLGHKPKPKRKRVPYKRSPDDLPPVVVYTVVIFTIVLFIVMPMVYFLTNDIGSPSVSDSVHSNSPEQPKGVITLRQYEEGEDAAAYLLDAYFELVSETSFTAEELYKLCMGEWETAEEKIVFLDDQCIVIERDGKSYSGTVDVTPAEKGAEISMIFHTEDEFYDNASAAAILFHPTGKSMVVTAADGSIHTASFLSSEE